MPTVLERIVLAKKEELRRRRDEEPLAALRQRVADLQARAVGASRRRLRDALRDGPGGRARLRVIAEVKMASPSAGRLMDDERRRTLPLLYAEHGAAAVSVLTEREHFLGDIRHLLEARDALDSQCAGSRPALLRKDFLFDPYHVWESRAYGADALLLIVAVLSDAQLREMLSLAHELEMDCLVEVHDEEELERALAAGAGIVGINNRDLRTFRVDLTTTERLRPLVPAGAVVVSESGIRSRSDAERMARCGVDAILVGEALVRAADAAAKLRELMV